MNEPIRVLHVIGIMDRGGAEMMIMNHYRQINRQKIQFDFVENENDGAYFDDEIRNLGGRIYHCPRFTGKNYLKYRKWWTTFFNKHREYSFVHGHIGSTACIYLKEAKRHGILTIAHSHNLDGKGKKQFLYNILSYPVRNITDYFFMCSRQAGIDRYGEKAISDPDKAFFIPNAIDIEAFRFNENTRKIKREEFGIKNEEVLIGHVGRFAEQKNHKYLLDIFEKAIEMNSSSKLLLVGDGELRTEIEAKIKKLGLNEKVILTGVRNDIDAIMAAMDVLVFPSKFEGLGVVLIEAQCNGLPCVISDNIPEESVLTKELVQVCSLDEQPSEWAKKALCRHRIDRSSYADRIKETEFDIEKSAKWLEEFYLEKSK